LIGKPSLAEHKIYKSGHYDLIKNEEEEEEKQYLMGCIKHFK